MVHTSPRCYPLISLDKIAIRPVKANLAPLLSREMSYFSTMIVGMAPFGSLLMGWAADHFGAPLLVAIGGGFCALRGLIFVCQLPRIRQAAKALLVARGIILESNVSE